jgi:integrase
MYVRGCGTIYRQKGSRFFWMQYWRNGEAHRESTKCEKAKAAQDVLRQRLSDLDLQASTPASAGPAPLLLGDLYESLQRDYVINARKTLHDLEIRWRKHLEDSFAAMPVRSLSAEIVSAYVARRLGEKAANATVNRELAILKRMYKLAITTGRLKAGDQPYFAMLKERNVRKGFVKDANYSELARATAAAGLWLRTLFELGYTYGWRKSELLGLRVSQIDCGERTIALDPGETKNDQPRLVEMTHTACQLLLSLIAGKEPEDRVFTRPARDGRERPIRNFRKAWQTATAVAGCPGLLFHDLRRSGVRNLIRAGVTEKVAMTISGHKTRSVFERYNIVSQTDLHQAAELLDKAEAERRQRQLFAGQAELSLEDEGAPPKPVESERSSGDRVIGSSGDRVI